MFTGCKQRPRDLEKYRQARGLRSSGKPFKQIADQLGISPDTVHRWTRDIVLTPAQQAAINQAAEKRWTARAISWSETCRQRRRDAQKEGRAKARECDQLHVMGSMLYWAEGSKQRNVMTFANSDPAMVELFARFLRESLGIENSKITMRLNVYLINGLSLAEVEAYWLDICGLPSSCCRKHMVNHFPTSSSGRRGHKLPYGVCSLSIGSTRAIQHVYGAIQEYSGIDQPAWLDGRRGLSPSAQQ